MSVLRIKLNGEWVDVGGLEGGVAEVALRLGTETIGSNKRPIYLNSGTATQCDDTIDVSISGSAATAAKATQATQDGSGNVIATTYATKSVVSTGQAGLAPARNGDGYSYLAGDGNWTKPPVMYVYSANFTAGSWLGDSTEGYIQTATITPVNGGPAVTETTQLSYPMGLPTGVKDTDAAIQAALDVINCGSSVPGNGTVTCTVWDAPETDVTVYWYGY